MAKHTTYDASYGQSGLYHIFMPALYDTADKSHLYCFVCLERPCCECEFSGQAIIADNLADARESTYIGSDTNVDFLLYSFVSPVSLARYPTPLTRMLNCTSSVQ